MTQSFSIISRLSHIIFFHYFHCDIFSFIYWLIFIISTLLFITAFHYFRYFFRHFHFRLIISHWLAFTLLTHFRYFHYHLHFIFLPLIFSIAAISFHFSCHIFDIFIDATLISFSFSPFSCAFHIDLITPLLSAYINDFIFAIDTLLAIRHWFHYHFRHFFRHCIADIFIFSPLAISHIISFRHWAFISRHVIAYYITHWYYFQ
jgi:hypothetical protein